MRSSLGIAVAFGAILSLTACDRKPPSEPEMLNALQAAFDAEAHQSGAENGKQIANLRSQNCEATALVGPVVYSCEVVLMIGGRETTPRRVLFHKAGNGWVVPP